MKNLTYIYDNLIDFYNDAVNPTSDGSRERCLEHLTREKEEFRGAKISEIKNRKFSYIEGLDNLEQLDIDLQVGGSHHAYKYDELDGDDLNYDRLLDGFPALRKRVKKHGIGNGRLINIYIVISENSDVTADEIMCKAYASIQIVDLLESLGYRVAVWSCDSTHDGNGTYKGEKNVHYEVRVCLKKHEDSLNKGLILNGVSSWFFRYYIFAHQMGRYKVSIGLGKSTSLNLENTKENIIINHGQCLSSIAVKNKLNEIKKLFGIDLIRYAINSSSSNFIE